MKTGQLIKDLRIKKGLTQEELADQTELSSRTIQRIENGEVDPRAYTLQMIAKALEVDFSLFLEEENESEEETINKDRFVHGMIHLSGFFPIFIPTLLIWKFNKQKVKGIYEHFIYVLSFQLTVLIMFILPGSAIQYWMNYNFIAGRAYYLIIGGMILSVALSIINCVYVMNGQDYKRFTIIKPLKNQA